MKLKQLAAWMLALMIAVGCALPAFADMDVPMVSELEGYVNKPLGIPLYDDKWDEVKKQREILPTGIRIPNGTKLILRGQYDSFDEVLAEEYYYTEYQGTGGYVKVSDVSLNLTAVTPKKEWKFKKADHPIVIEPAGAPMRTGPDRAYEEVGTIPYGTEITCEYGNVELFSSEGKQSWTTAWSFTTYKGVSGWVETPQYGNAYVFGYKEPGESLVVEDSRMYQTIKQAYENDWEEEGQKEAIATVPAGAFVTYDLIYRGNTRTYGYVTWNGKTGWMLVSDGFHGPGTYAVIPKTEGYVMVVAPKGAPVYSKIGDRNSKTGDTIPAYQVLRYDYYGLFDYTEYDDEYEPIEDYDCWRWYRVPWNGKTVWVGGSNSQDDTLSGFFYIEKERVTAADGVSLYAQPRTSAEKVAVVPKGAVLQTEFEWQEKFVDYDSDENVKWKYGEYQGQFGWVRLTGDDEDSVLESVDEERDWSKKETPLLPDEVKIELGLMEAPSTAPTETAAETSAAETTASGLTTKAEPAMAAKASPRTIVIGCVAAAAVLALVAGVSIALVRKKKSQN